LATVNSNVGTFGDATHVPAITVNAKGLTTAVTSTAITFPVTLSNSVALTNKDLTGAGNTFPTFNQNTTGTAANITASSNSTLTTLSALSLPYSQLTGTPSLTGFVPYTGATGNVNLGTNFITAGASLTPLAPIHAISTISTNPRGILSDQNTADAVGARITMRKSRGTPSSPTVITTADVLGSWTAAGYDGTNYIDAGKVLVTSAGTIATNQVPSVMELQTANSSGTLTDGIKIDQAQALTFGAYGTGLLHSSSAGAITSSSIVNADIAASTIDLTAKVTGLLPVANGGTGTASPGIVAGTNITVTGTWPNQTVNASGGGGGSPAGSDTQVQFNQSGAFGADANFVWDYTNHRLGLGATPAATLDLGAVYSTSNYKFRTGSLIFQPYALNNVFIAENAYYNGSSWTRISTGYTEGFQANNGQFGFFAANTGSGTFSPQIALKVDYNNNVALGGNISFSGAGTYTNAVVVVNNAGRVMIANPTFDDGSTALQVYGTIRTPSIVTLGVNSIGSGQINWVGSTSGNVSMKVQAAAGTYNLNLPITAGSINQVLTSQGGGSSAMTWTYPISKPHNISTPVTGGTVNLTNNQYNIINPSGALATLTVNLPSSPANNDCVYIKYTQAITAVTYGNGTVVDGITAPTAGGLVVLTYDSGTTSWY